MVWFGVDPKKTLVFWSIMLNKADLTIKVSTFFIHSNSLTFPWLPKIFPLFFTKTFQSKNNNFFFHVASTYDWVCVHRNTNLLQIRLTKVKPAQVFPQTKRFENGFEKKSLVMFSLILAEPPSMIGKTFQNFPWSMGTLYYAYLPPTPPHPNTQILIRKT